MTTTNETEPRGDLRCERCDTRLAFGSLHQGPENEYTDPSNCPDCRYFDDAETEAIIDRMDGEECHLCGGCEEVTVVDLSGNPQTVGCPECIEPPLECRVLIAKCRDLIRRAYGTGFATVEEAQPFIAAIRESLEMLDEAEGDGG